MIRPNDPNAKLLNQRLKAVLSALAAANVPEDALDDAVREAASEIASEANNGGRSEQVLFLLQQGWKPSDILFRANQDSASDSPPDTTDNEPED